VRPQRWVRDNFLAGLAIVLPVALSIFLFTWGLQKITGGIFNWLSERYGLDQTWPEGKVPDQVRISVQMLILFVLIVVTIMIGWLARTIIGKHLIKLGDMVLQRIPLFNRVYTVLRQISQSVLSEKSEMFSEVVLIEFPRPGIRSLAFITGRSRGEIQDKTEGEVFTLFVPTSPNPTSGYMIVAAETEFDRLDMSVEEGMKMVISGGAVLPEGGTLMGRRKVRPGPAQPPGTGEHTAEPGALPPL
jgi:uncharacterized membrane protein